MAQIDAISKPEAVKQQSRQLRGHIARDLADTTTPFDKEGYALLKFHGIYQGYDRDSATERKQRGEDKVWQFMVRARIPGGRLTADQYLALDAIADSYANGSLRITTREGIQFHGVVKAGLKSAIAEINGALLTTLAACGDVVRNVTTVPACIAGSKPMPVGCRHICYHGPAPITKSGSTARPGRKPTAQRKNRTPSTASAICHGSSRSASRSPKTTRSTS
jgi:sulfite reductase beta subunit-like hemoprotein